MERSTRINDSEQTQLRKEGYEKAVELLGCCRCPEGFLASPTDKANYRRIWGRDGVIIGLAGLLTGDSDLIETFRRNLQTLAQHQGPHGEIPSNVDPTSERVSFGGTTGRVDADLWFIIGCGEYWRATGDDAFLEVVAPAIEKVRFLLGAWEFNNRGLLYVPATGDWADEYIHNGYILYDQALYLQALRTLCAIRAHVHGTQDHALCKRVSHLKHLIRDNYWFEDEDGEIPDDVYHEILYKKGRRASRSCENRHWMPFFSPHGYGYRFDAFANVLVSLLDISDERRRDRVDKFIEALSADFEIRLLPAFHPVIKPVDKDWKELNITFSYTFRNKPYEYHNGGLWPMITGFYVADLARRDKKPQAQTYLDGIHRANASEMQGSRWSFPEFIHGRDFTPGGTREQCWSAAGAIIGHRALEGAHVFRIDETKPSDTALQ
jgi:glycogen debranching enzyme